MMATISDEFVRQMQSVLPDEIEAFLAAMREEPVVSIRLNRRKIGACEYSEKRVPWCDYGYYLPQRIAFTFDPAMHGGVYYVQDASSMFICHVVRQLMGDRPTAYLDLCAAPGGKSTAAIDALSDDSFVVCNEIDKTRARILWENVVKWGAPNCAVTNGSADRLGLLRNCFDVIAADMPCSGEGMFRKDDEARAQWSPSLVEQCAARQRKIATDVWDALKPGGYFIYSTCTFNRSENEETADFIARHLGADYVDVAIDPEWGIANGIVSSGRCYRFFPHRVNGEGLFVAVLQKRGSEKEQKANQKEERRTRRNCPVGKWIKNPELLEFEMDNDGCNAIPAKYAKFVGRLRSVVDVLAVGVRIAEKKGKDLAPAHALSQSVILNRDAFPEIELGYADIIKYLRGETIALSGNDARGYALATYRGRVAGFMKNLGTRANNCYPKEWRIRSTHVPETNPDALSLLGNRREK